MATFYLDIENGNDANDGLSYANRWKTIQLGATAARIGPGDTIRVMSSLSPYLLGNCTWTDGSATVTLDAARTQLISDCDSAWTPSANVTANTSTASYKSGTTAVTLAIASAFTTGKIGYSAVGTLNLSSYERVCLWVQSTLSLAAGVLSLRLCSDTAGNTTVHTLPLPAVSATMQAIVLDAGGAMGSSIQSVALYADSDPGTTTITLDNINACHSAGDPNELTLHTLISKDRHRPWQASTAYSLNAIRKPTQPNRNGFCYQVTTAGTSGASEPDWPDGFDATVTDGTVVWTCIEVEEPWFAIASINGTTVGLDTGGRPKSNHQPYCGTTETVATYARTPIVYSPQPVNTFITATSSIQDSGTATGGNITFSGGWNRTDMSTQDDETWLTGATCFGTAVHVGIRDFITIENINGVRFYGSIRGNSDTSSVVEVRNAQGNCCGSAGMADMSFGLLKMRGVVTCMNFGPGNDIDSSQYVVGVALRADSNYSGGTQCGIEVAEGRLNFVQTGRNAQYGIAAPFNERATNLAIRNWISRNSGAAALNWGTNSLVGVDIRLFNCDFTGETNIISSAEWGSSSTVRNAGMVSSERHNQTANNHILYFNGGTITSATDRRYTASGISWKFQPIRPLLREENTPLRLSVAKIACGAGSPVSVQIMTNRNSADIKGRLMIEGGSIMGVNSDISVACEPAVDTWVQSDPLTFTPTEACVAEIYFEVFDEVGSSNSYWVDDVTVTS